MTDFTFGGIQFRPDNQQPSTIVLGADAIRDMARIHGVTPADFVKNAADHVMTTVPADNEDGFAVVSLSKCEWNEEENKA